MVKIKYLHYLWNDKVFFESGLELVLNKYCKLWRNHLKWFFKVVYAKKEKMKSQ